MRHLLILSSVLFALGLNATAHAQAPPAKATARALVVERGGPWPACGVLAVQGEVVYEVVEAGEGSLAAGQRFVGVHLCPGLQPLIGELRLELQSSEPRGGWPGSLFGKRGPTDLPRWWVLSADPWSPPETKGTGKLIGNPRTEIEATHTPTGHDADWTLYGPHLAIRYADERAVAVRARIAPGLACELAARWMGFGPQPGGRALRKRWGCAWPGVSDKHRLAAGVAATLRDGLFEVVQSLR